MNGSKIFLELNSILTIIRLYLFLFTKTVLIFISFRYLEVFISSWYTEDISVGIDAYVIQEQALEDYNTWRKISKQQQLHSYAIITVHAQNKKLKACQRASDMAQREHALSPVSIWTTVTSYALIAYSREHTRMQALGRSGLIASLS